MGNKGCCSCNNNDNSTTNLENKVAEQSNDQNNNENIENTNQSNNIINFPSDLKEFIKNKITNQKEKILNITSYFGFCEERLYDESEIKQIIIIQKNYRGFEYRKNYPNIKLTQIEYTNYLIKELKEKYNTINLEKAEKLIENQFDTNSWKKFYFNESEETITKLFYYDFGKTFYQRILIVENNSFYQGDINIKYERNGYGILLKNKGIKYEGSFRRNFFTGWGRYIDEEGTFYEGYFINGKLTGKGFKKSLNGNFYIGDFIGNKKEGKGKEETTEHIYEGDFKNDKKNGNGKLIYKLLKDTYEGEFKDNNITGNGIYTWVNNDTYKGSFLNGKMHGKGLYKWPDGGEYYGDYVNNIKEGIGRFKWANGKIYEGQFKNGRPSGFGKLKTGNWEFDVEFLDGKLVTNIKEIMRKEKKAEMENKKIDDDDISKI